MGLLSDFKSLIGGTMDEEISKEVKTRCAGVRDRPCLPELREWFTKNVKAWLTDIYGKGEREWYSVGLSVHLIVLNQKTALQIGLIRHGENLNTR
jgi:hypothetical protein